MDSAGGFSGGELEGSTPEQVSVALDTLSNAGIDVTVRKPFSSALSRTFEMDLWVARSDRRRLDTVLSPVGFHRAQAPGRGSHVFFVTCSEGRWYKLDFKLQPRRFGVRAPRLVRRWGQRLRRKMPVAIKRTGSVVAILGPDGAGKGTVIEELRRTIPLAVSVRYFGWHRRSRSKGAGATNNAHSARRVAPGLLREVIFVVRSAMRQSTRLATAYQAAWRGHIVLCDRYPLEVLATATRRTRAARTLERFVVSRLFPNPDLLVLLDAPGHTLYERKGEHTVAKLDEQRRRLREELVPRGAHVVSTTGPLADTLSEVSDLVWHTLRDRAGST